MRSRSPFKENPIPLFLDVFQAKGRIVPGHDRIFSIFYFCSLRIRTPAMEGPTPAMESPRILRAIKIHQRPSIKRNLVYPGPRRIRGAETAGAAETARLTSSEVGRELPRSLERRKTRRRGNERSGNVEAPWSHRGVIAELGHRSKDRR